MVIIYFIKALTQGVPRNIGTLATTESLIKIRDSFIRKLSRKSPPFSRYKVLLLLN